MLEVLLCVCVGFLKRRIGMKNVVLVTLDVCIVLSYHLTSEEFFAQGDQEKAMGIPVQFLNDRDKVACHIALHPIQAASWIGFYYLERLTVQELLFSKPSSHI